MFVIGTAGHVDHGKSTLVQALTGIDPDRLSEEKARAMTIDLGFAWLRLGGVESEIGVVDVPGHRDFIENMLAGVGGIDLALFVISAEEGVMPQTREHLAILDLLEIKRGLIAITKVDLIDDPDWIELVMLDIAEVVDGTVLADAPIIAVSAHAGTGLTELKAQIVTALNSAEPKPDTGRPRLPIDRVFSISGFGTIVTGTLIGGQLRIGDEVVLQPAGHVGRVRGLQTHKTKRDVARPGSRVAVNISNIDKSDVKRGNVLTLPEIIQPTTLLDVRYRHLADALQPLKHNSEVKLFVGSAETIARVRLIGSEQIDPGQDGFLQLSLRSPMAAVRGDRFILRRPSPGATLGGGTILDPHPGRQHRRFRGDTLKRLQTLADGTPDELLLSTLARIEPTSAANLRQQIGMDSAEFETLLADSIAQQRVLQLGKVLVSAETFHTWKSTVESLVVDFHKTNPLRLGISREEVRSRMKQKAAVFNPLVALLVNADILSEDGALLRKPTHAVTFSESQTKRIEALTNRFNQAGVNTPSVKETIALVGDDVYQALLDLGQLVQVSKDVVWLREKYAMVVSETVQFICQHDAVTVGDLRDLFGTSRKYAIGLLEHLDDIGVTRRSGDARTLLDRSGCGE